MPRVRARPFSVWLEDEERERLDRAAESVGVPTGTLLRRGGLEWADRLLDAGSRPEAGNDMQLAEGQ